MRMRKKREISIPSMEQLEAERERIEHNKRFRRTLSSTINILLVVAAISVLISTLFLPVLQISGTSMEPTLKDGEIILLVKTDQYQTGDLCSFTWNNRTLIKRVIAGPGDWVEINEEGDVYVNEKLLEEPYVSEKSLGECDLEFPYQVPENSYFLVGDHRSTSIDSRSSVIGSVRVEQTIGKVIFRVWPLAEFGVTGNKLKEKYD